jgi:hypothetical protein
MKLKKPLVTQVENDDGVIVEIELPTSFLNFYKKETGHSNITKKGVTRFLNNLIKQYKN